MITDYPVFLYISTFSCLIPIFTGVFKFKSINQGAKLVVLLLSLGFLIDLFSLWPIFGYKIIPLFSHFYGLVECIIVLFILSLWQYSKRICMAIRFTIGAFILFWIASKLTFEPFNTPCIITASVSRIILTLAAGYSLYLIFENSQRSLLKNQIFWILLSFIFNFSGTLLPFIFEGVLFGHSKDFLYTAWSITWFLTLTSNVLFTIGFLCPQTQT